MILCSIQLCFQYILGSNIAAMSVANIIDCLQKMVQAGFEGLRDEPDLLVSTLTQLSKNCDQAIVLLQQYSIECGAEIFVSGNSVDHVTQPSHVTGDDHVTNRYIRLVYWLLAKLNSTIKQEVELFEARQSENLPSVKNEHTAPLSARTC
ncbi:hypothetical protein EB796_006132 [Bugula neritina]|uniref:TANGO6 n=1 Tax=Bugula neritina TaxID=10212 RepID=A0A7J7KA77_BUGNE|nr:hypothetical protein EB796_006132 [Bugula neritina]